MTLKQEIHEALVNGLDHESLLALVRGREPDARRAYELLEEVWRELELDSNRGARGQETLEFVMERLWYSCPAPETTG